MENEIPAPAQDAEEVGNVAAVALLFLVSVALFAYGHITLGVASGVLLYIYLRSSGIELTMPRGSKRNTLEPYTF